VNDIPSDWIIFPVHGTTSDGCSCGDLRCTSPGKHPAIKGWLKAALPREQALQKWPEHSGNWGVIPGRSGFVGFDIDVKDGKQGQQSFKTLQEKYGKAPDTMVIKTPTGGFHVFLQRPDIPIIPNTNGSIYNGIDVRCDNGYLVAVGSIIFDKKYELFKNDPIAPLPDAWLPLVLPRAEEPIPDQQIVTRGDYSLPDCSSYQSQSEADFSLAGRMKSAGCDFEEFCKEVGNLRLHDKKSHSRKYLQATWQNASIIDDDDAEIDLVGFVDVPAGEYIWHCHKCESISPFGRKTFRFYGAIVCGEYQGVILPLYVAKIPTRASKLSKIWSIVGDGQPKFRYSHILERTYLVQVSESSNGSIVNTIISPKPQRGKSLKPNNKAISPKPQPAPVTHIYRLKDSDSKEAIDG